MLEDAFLDAISQRSGTSPYEATATVTRVDADGTAWVHIPGGVDETPASMAVDCRAGDSVRVSVQGGKAYVTGNTTAPPTDDATAIVSKIMARAAQGVASNASTVAAGARETAEGAARDAKTAGDAAKAAVADAAAAKDAAASAKTSATEAATSAASAAADAKSAKDNLLTSARAASMAQDAAEAAQRAADQTAIVSLVSTNGSTFRNSSGSTQYKAVVFHGGNQIRTKEQLTAEFGAGAYLEWAWGNIGDDSLSVLVVTDPRISDDGFTLTVTADDVDGQAVIQCNLYF